MPGSNMPIEMGLGCVTAHIYKVRARARTLDMESRAVV